MVEPSTASPWCLAADAGLTTDRRAELGTKLSAYAGRANAILLATCQRVELYGLGHPPPAPRDSSLLLSDAAARHLFRVAAGLESAAVGEPEILGQVRHAFAATSREGSVDEDLNRLFAAAIATGRRCRAGLEPSGSSLAAVAVRALLDRITNRSPSILVVGAGYMGRALAAGLAPRCSELLIASRNRERAMAVGASFSATALTLEDAAPAARRVSGIAVALAGRWEAAFEPGCLGPTVDVSSPPGLDSAASSDYFGVDQLLAAAGRESKANGYAARAERVVEAELAAYLDAAERRRLRVAV